MAGRLVWGLVAVAGCASAADPAAIPDAPVAMHDSAIGGDGATAHACGADQFVTAVAADGTVSCAPVTEPTRAAIAASCSTYLAWRDGCDGCTSVPTKYGNAGGTCSVGVGADNTCTTPNLGGATVALLGLNMDGNVDGNDKLYGSLHCTVPAPASTPAPCAAGEYVTGSSSGGFTCAPLAAAVVDYVRASCSLYLGWQDSCDGCTTFPAKWGHAGDAGCQNGAGLDDTCTVATLGTEQVNLFGISPDGDVDDNDKIHVGLHCNAPPPASTSTTTTCPAGQFVTGTGTDASLQCASPAPLFHTYFTQHCSVYFGWRDGCDGCTLAPAKWGQVKVGGCTLGTGVNDTCSTFMMGQPVSMFGLNVDGDVDGNDALYATLHCE